MRTHRDLIAFRVSWQLAVDVQRWTEANWSPPRTAMHDQLRRAALSVPLNIAEGHAYGRGPRCRHHLRIAYGSAVEVETLLGLFVELDAPVERLRELAGRSGALTLRLWQRTPT